MIVVTRVEDIHEALHGACLTIGNFDGVHMGHVKLLQRVRDRAAAAGLVSVALTFDPHPRRVLYATYSKASEGDQRERYYRDKRHNYPPDIEREPGRTYTYKV